MAGVGTVQPRRTDSAATNRSGRAGGGRTGRDHGTTKGSDTPISFAGLTGSAVLFAGLLLAAVCTWGAEVFLGGIGGLAHAVLRLDLERDDLFAALSAPLAHLAIEQAPGLLLLVATLALGLGKGYRSGFGVVKALLIASIAVGAALTVMMTWGILNA